MLMLLLFLTLRKRLTQSIMISYGPKLHLYSISGVTHKYFSSCLDNHTQKCLVNGSLSECCTFECGIPQGTILGPLLFLLYINDLPNCLFHFEQRMHVNDTHLTYLHGNIHFIQSLLNEDLLNIKRWLIADKLLMSNMTKTESKLKGARQKLKSTFSAFLK